MANELVEQYELLLQSDDVDLVAFLQYHPQLSPQQRLQLIMLDQRKRFESANPRSVEDYLQRLPELRHDHDAFFALVVAEHRARAQRDIAPDIAELTRRFPQLADRIREHLRSADTDAGEQRIDVKTDQPKATSLGETFSGELADQQLLAGRYRTQRLLGQGGFGRVYLGFDTELQRSVAIKVPKPERFRGPEDTELYLAEARTVAALDHPHIVPVYDMGRTDEGAIFVVSRFVDGGTLATMIQERQIEPERLARLLQTIAIALDHAHQRRLIHRDIKPANILIEASSGQAFLTDFGLAIREEDYAKHPAMAGTPPYMSPEQARGEGHRLDARSDLFSLGTVMFEALTGRRPFLGSTVDEVLHHVISTEPAAPRSLSPEIPGELERICLKLLSKQASDRYNSAAAVAEDLAAWLAPGPTSSLESADERPVVPKGLRSFDAGDADFFLSLLPGSRNRVGLPESIAFWKERIEETDPEQTFSVGLIYGPSGCGKSSLVKAGLLPRLSGIEAIFVEATPHETEIRLQRAIHKRFPQQIAEGSSQSPSLTETLAARRRSDCPKVVVIIDQFEQWLHTNAADTSAELVMALRQCDGGRLQAIVMIRDDFAMAAARFMDAVDVPILQGENFETVDLFDVDHAAKVLTKFGRAFAQLPASPTPPNKDQQQFIAEVASGLAQDGRVISVRLSLFAEMIKSKPWVPQTLRDIGGTTGIGVNFLEETFAARSANPMHRRHASAAERVLRGLLPDVGSDIKGHMRSAEVLREISGYQEREGDFRNLLRILDGELRLITPTDPEGRGADDSTRDSTLDARYYQLTHDYLVPSLREWLTRKQQETRRGRAELKLQERSSHWNAKPENRYLPSLREWAQIRTLTDRQRWTEPQQKLMRRAGRFHALWTAGVLLLLTVATASGLAVRRNVVQERERMAAEIAEQQNVTSAERLVESLATADTAQVPEIVRQLEGYSQWAEPLLVDALARAPADSTEKLHLSLARVATDDGQLDFLYEQLLRAEPNRFPVIRDTLAIYQDRLHQRLWQVLTGSGADPKRLRLRAAGALAHYDPENAIWDRVAPSVAEQLVSVSPVYLRDWMLSLQPIGQKLIAPLSEIYRDRESRPSDRALATEVLAEYAADETTVLVDFIQDADEEQFAVIFPRLEPHGEKALELLEGELAAPLSPGGYPIESRLAHARRQAGAAIALLRRGEREKILSILRIRDYPESLTQFAHRCRERGVSVEELWDCVQVAERMRPALRGESRRVEDRVVYGLLLALGEFSPSELPDALRYPMIDQIADWFRDDPSSAIHGAAGWLLRHWGQEELAREIEESPVPYDPNREWFRLVLPVGEQNFIQTYVVFQPGEYEIGSPTDEPGRDSSEIRHRVRLTHPFAILDREITRAEFEASGVASLNVSDYSLTPDHTMVATSWYDSVRFCRWLTAQSGLPETEQCYFDPESLDPNQHPPDPVETAKDAPKNWPFDFQRRGFRLPTEAEWEVAARGGMRSAYGFGDDVELLDRYGWFQQNSGRKAQVPRQLRSNARGLFDMHGNVYDWCHDWSGSYKPVAGLNNSSGPLSGSYRVSRGGGWSNAAAYCRAASRRWNEPALRGINGGFRLALAPLGIVDHF